jgi:hypothetical protein
MKKLFPALSLALPLSLCCCLSFLAPMANAQPPEVDLDALKAKLDKLGLGTKPDASKKTPGGPPVFEKKGFKLATKQVVYGVDYTFLLAYQGSSEVIAMGRTAGLTGTDSDVLRGIRANPTLYAKAERVFREKLTARDLAKLDTEIRISGGMEGFAFPLTQVLITDKYLKSQPMPGTKSMVSEGLGMYGVGLANLQRRTSQTVGTFMGVSALLTDATFNLDTIFGLATLTKEQLSQQNATTKVILGQQWGTYRTNMIHIEIPVEDEGGNPLYDMLSGGHQPKRSGKKILIDLHYTHDLDKQLPAGLAVHKNKLNVDGFFVGAHLYTDKKTGCIFKIQSITPYADTYESEFIAPSGYPQMTDEQLAMAILKNAQTNANK